MSLTKPSSTKPPESQYTFFTDADLGEMIPRALEEIGFSVERHRAHFSGPTKDPIWLAEVGRRGWIALTHDKRQRRRRDEVDAIMTSGLAAFILIGRNHQQITGNLIATIRSVISFRAKHEPPFIAKIYQPDSGAREHAKRSGGTVRGRVEMSLSHTEWLAQLRQAARGR